MENYEPRNDLIEDFQEQIKKDLLQRWIWTQKSEKQIQIGEERTKKKYNKEKGLFL